MAVSPLENAEGPVRVELRSHGKPLQDGAAIVGLTVRHAADSAAATLVFAGDDSLTGGFALFNSADFKFGAELTIRAGYGRDDSEIFSGSIVEHKLQIGSDLPVRLVIECRGKASAPPDPGPARLKIAYGESLLMLDAELDARRRQRGCMRFQGSALATVGSLIELNGVGAHFGGPVRASGVTHTIEAGGWTTEVAFGEAVEQPVALADAHGNSIRLNAAGITVKSAGQITLSATGSITVSASGQTTVKGSIVNIN